MEKKPSRKKQPPPDLSPNLKFRMGLALMGEENARLYLAWLRAEQEKRLREEAALMPTANKLEVAS
jgi:hypothetical protein